MEGRWGRRVFGTVARGPARTIFNLELKTREGAIIHSRIIVANEDLEHYPGHYGQVLDRMVEKIEEAINHTRGDQP
jgi:hypothetical protein